VRWQEIFVAQENDFRDSMSDVGIRHIIVDRKQKEK